MNDCNIGYSATVISAIIKAVVTDRLPWGIDDGRITDNDYHVYVRTYYALGNWRVRAWDTYEREAKDLPLDEYFALPEKDRFTWKLVNDEERFTLSHAQDEEGGLICGQCAHCSDLTIASLTRAAENRLRIAETEEFECSCCPSYSESLYERLESMVFNVLLTQPGELGDMARILRSPHNHRSTKED